MRSHSGERPFVCLICLSAFTTKANCERHLKVHTDTLSGVCHSCGFISTTRDILYSHLVTNHMVCQPGSKGEIYSPGAGHPAAKLPPDGLASIQQHSAPHGPRASGDLGLAPAPSPGQDRKVLVEATNGEARVAPQNGDGSETPAAPRSIKVEAVEEPEAARAPGPGEPGAQALSRTPSPHSPAAARVKAEVSSPTPGSSPGPGELGLAGALFLPHYVFGPDAGAPSGAPQASEILAKMSELVHSRLQQGAGVAGTPAGLFAGAKGATCFECEITFNNVNNFYVHKRLYCSGRRPPEDTPAARRPKAIPGPPRATPGPPAEPEATRSSPGPGTREDEAGGAATPEAEAAGRGSEGSQSPGSSVDDAEDDPSRTLCEACNIRFSRHETYTVHKRYYCASRHDPPPRRPPAPAPTPGTAPPALTAPPVRTRRRRKLYELHAAGPAPPAAGPAPDADLLLSAHPQLVPPCPTEDVFPCKDCGIWYRSERNLQAHLLYYCASRQSAGSPATAATEEKPKESYPNERVCPFPQCRKSCPSASSLEIHMRSHSGEPLLDRHSHTSTPSSHAVALRPAPGSPSTCCWPGGTLELALTLPCVLGERPFVCLICLSAFTTKANCERHLKVHTDTLSGVCHSCGFISTTRDILYSHLVTNHMVCQPGSKGEIYSPGAGHPAAKLPPDGLASIQQHSAPHGPRASGDLGLAPAPSPGQDRKVLVEATNGEARVAPQNGDGSETPAAPRSIKVEAVEEPEAARAPGPGEPGAQALSRTPSPHSPAAARVKAEVSSPTPGSSPGPGELGLAGALFLPHYVFGPDAGAPSGAPQASEILAKMSELVHSRLQQGAGVAGTPAGLFAGAKGATCFECEITFNNVNNFYVHKRLYCSGRRPPEDTPAARRPKAIPGPPRATPGPPAEPEATRSSPGPGTREDEAGGAATPEAEAAGRGSEGSQSPGSSVDDAEDDPSRTLCEACNIRFSRHETYTVHKRYYCASRHDPPPRRPPAPAPTPGTAPPALTAPPVRTRRRRKLYELHAAGPAPPAAGPAPAPPGPAPEPPASPRPGSGIAGPAPEPAADGPIDLSKRPRRQPPDAPAALPALADYHECTACRVSFHSLEAYLAHKQYSCPAAPLRPAAACPYCPPSARARGDLLEHLRLAHGLRVARPEPSALDSPEGRAPRSPSPPAPNADPADLGTTTPSKGPPAPAASSHRYCRLCNIRFSSLSTFIAHKKYYCSSHAAEHVK
ncbi:Hypothetical predicted protein [Marmota monax]|nr:Hypothetical predicted protein [Marmota monax]